MKKFFNKIEFIFVLPILMLSNILFAQTTISYSEYFTEGQSYNSSTSQWINWSSFIAQLSPRTYSSVTIKGSNDVLGVSVTDATVATAIANALFTGTPGSWTSGGHSWKVGTCASAMELSAGTSGVCTCESAYTIRPQIGNSNWGGVNSIGCNSGSQTMTVVFEAGTASTQTYNFTGSVQYYTVPSGVTSVTIEMWGGQGASTSYSGGLGGYAKGNLAVTPGEVLNIYVGGQGGVYAVGDQGNWTAGGWNGGGLGFRYGRGGGGASDVRKGGTSLGNRVIVAAGGGGASDASQCYGGSGGGISGNYGLHFNVGDPGFCGQGGTQSAGGTACTNNGSAAGGGSGQGGNGGTSGYSDGSGGGGGYYGGGGGDQGGAGGGSSYIGGVTSALTTPGLRSGNGQISITSQSFTNDQTYLFSGSPQTWVVPPGVTTVTIEAWGAQGWSGLLSGGSGGYVKGDLSVIPGQTLNIYVGGQGTAAVGNADPGGGGWNGGGDGQTDFTSDAAGGGGGASDVRLGGTALSNRVIVAAGGGGSTNNTGCNGGNGGGLSGTDGGGTYSPGTGGSQIAGGNAGGAFGQGGNATTGMVPWNGGGGGGYFGGGVSVAGGPGGGGSSYTGALTNTENNAGVRTGNGLVVITYTLTTITIPNSPTVTFGTGSVDLIATVSPDPGGGMVDFFIDGSLVGSAALDAGTGIATLNFPITSLGIGSYSVRCDFGGFNGYPASSSNPSSNGTLTITGPGFIWEGDESTDWDIPGNWNTNQVPADGNDVTIPAGMPYQPHITSDPLWPSICNTLSISSGATLTIDAGKALTVNGAMCNSTGSAGLIIENGGSLINGTTGINANVKCGIAGNEWHLISSPVSNATSGMFMGKYLQEHSELTNTYSDILVTSQALSPSKGFALWGDETGFTANFAGSLNSGTQNFNTTYSGTGKGWNLTGNPYPSSINWNASGWTKTNLNASVYIHKNASTWATYNGSIGVNGGSQYIAPCQGFFVEASAAGVLAMTDNVRVHNSTAYFKNTGEVVKNMIRLEVSGNGFNDEAAVCFNDEATSEFDGKYDAHKLFGDVAEAAQIYTLGNIPLAINYLPFADVVQVGIHAGMGGYYTISATEINDLNEVTLEDRSTGIFTNLWQGSYTFLFIPGENEQRFVLHLGPLGIIKTENLIANINTDYKTVIIGLNSTLKGDVYIYNISGQLVATLYSAQGSNRINLNEAGYYIVKVITDKTILVKRILIQ